MTTAASTPREMAVDDRVYYEPPECSREHCRDPHCPYPHHGAWFVVGEPGTGYASKGEALEVASSSPTPSSPLRVDRDAVLEEALVTNVARALWEDLNVPKGRNWDDHAVSAARIYWSDRARTAIRALKTGGQS